MKIMIKEHCGSFAENKDQARDIRDRYIRPVLKSSNEVIVLDFSEVDSSTQSFIHALISGFFINPFGVSLKVFLPIVY